MVVIKQPRVISQKWPSPVGQYSHTMEPFWDKGRPPDPPRRNPEVVVTVVRVPVPSRHEAHVGEPEKGEIMWDMDGKTDGNMMES